MVLWRQHISHALSTGYYVISNLVELSNVDSDLSGSFSVAGNRVLYKNSKDKYEKHPYVMRFIYIAYASVMTAA